MHTFYPYIRKEIKINQFQVLVERLTLFESAELRVGLYSDDGKLMEWRNFILSGEDYIKWTDDDKYVINYVKQRLRSEYERNTGIEVVKRFSQGTGRLEIGSTLSRSQMSGFADDDDDNSASGQVPYSQNKSEDDTNQDLVSESQLDSKN